MMRIGFVGLGTMGEPMCRNLIMKSGCEVWIYNRTRRKMQSLADTGAVPVDSLEELAHNCEAIISMVTNSRAVEDIYGILIPEVRKGTVLIDMSTIEPSVSMELSRKAEAMGAWMLDAPVVKSRPAAVSGDLGIYVGGNREAFERVKFILECMGKNIIYLGDNGRGLVMKLCHNMLVAQIQNGVNEMMALGQTCGIDIEDAARAVSYGGGQNFYLDSKKDSIKSGDFSPKFTIANMNKDINMAAKLAEELKLALPGVRNVQRIYERAMKDELQEEDFSATYKTVCKIVRE